MRVPTELLERIIYFYFQRDELLHLPEDNFTLITPSRGSTSLLLVSKDFRQLVLPSLYESVSITEQSHYEALFKQGSGILDGEGDEAKLRRSWVRELRIDLSVEIGMALDSNGELPSDPHQQEQEEEYYDLPRRPPCIIITESYPSLFPNLDRVTLLVSSLLPRPLTSAPSHSWPIPHIEKLKKRHLDLWRSQRNGLHASDPQQLSNLLQNVAFESLSSHSWMQKSDFLTWLEPRNVWFSLMNGALGDLPNLPLWRTPSTIKHLVHPPPLHSSSPSSSSFRIAKSVETSSSHFDTPKQAAAGPSTSSSSSTSNAPPKPQLPHIAYGLGFSERSLVAQGLRFVEIPRGSRKKFMKLYVEDATRRYAGMQAFEDEDEDEEEEEYYERPVTYGSFLELARSQWKWVEEDGTEVGFEEGMKYDEEGKEEVEE